MNGIKCNVQCILECYVNDTWHCFKCNMTCDPLCFNIICTCWSINMKYVCLGVNVTCNWLSVNMTCIYFLNCIKCNVQVILERNVNVTCLYSFYWVTRLCGVLYQWHLLPFSPYVIRLCIYYDLHYVHSCYICMWY